MRRLSIIDLAGGQQPVWNETRDVAVVYNGELYNYRELRERLALLGHRFATQSDTEILVHAWEEWGEECLTELRGMFAFALLDLRGRFATAPLLFLARDPLGIKPLYYTQTAEGFAFASEVRCSAGERDRAEADFSGCAYFLSAFRQHIGASKHGGGSIFSSARPSHAACMFRNDGACRERGRGGIRKRVLRRATRANPRIWIPRLRGCVRFLKMPCVRI